MNPLVHLLLAALTAAEIPADDGAAAAARQAAAPASAKAEDAFISSIPGESRERHDARMKWWREAKFGMFVHWGVYAVPAGSHQGKATPGTSEWLMHYAKIPMADYQAYARQFNPVKFNAAEFVGIAKDAGMKYIVITVKHHDGFAMFDTQANAWSIVRASPYGKDPIKALAEECRKQGIRLGFYYSQGQDWNNRGSAYKGKWDAAQEGAMSDYVDKTVVPQIRELLSHYGDDTPALLWWDSPEGIDKAMATRINDAVQSLRPGIIMNNRLANRYAVPGFAGDTETPEQHIPARGYPGRDWESCMTIGRSWGYKSGDHDWKPAELLIRNLCDIASKGGNYLLNVGPDALGEIPEGSRERLAALGRWMKVNGEAIHGSRGTPFGSEFGEEVDGKDGYGAKARVSSRMEWRATQKGDSIYVMIFKWPEGGILKLPPLQRQVLGARLLAVPAHSLEVMQSPQGIEVKGLPLQAPDAAASVLVLKCK
ncbi:MAG: hypothetical protein RL095_2446 [Verrucomicrobiota bacterium]|jgi:alpha-L-fucosidase